MSAQPINIPQPSDTLKFETNIPYTVALKFAAGKPYPGDYGDRYLFTLADGLPWKRMYVPPHVNDMIVNERIQPGQPFIICKQEYKDGRQRRTQFVIETKLSAPVATQLEQELAASVAALQGKPASPPPPGYYAPPEATAPGESNMMRTCLMQAIAAAAEGESYAKECGLPLEFNAEDIRAMAITVYIARAK
jgi:hypothetical protein